MARATRYRRQVIANRENYPAADSRGSSWDNTDVQFVGYMHADTDSTPLDNISEIHATDLFYRRIHSKTNVGFALTAATDAILQGVFSECWVYIDVNDPSKLVESAVAESMPSDYEGWTSWLEGTPRTGAYTTATPDQHFTVTMLKHKNMPFFVAGDQSAAQIGGLNCLTDLQNVTVKEGRILAVVHMFPYLHTSTNSGWVITKLNYQENQFQRRPRAHRR